jgi:hypothetical protein
MKQIQTPMQVCWTGGNQNKKLAQKITFYASQSFYLGEKHLFLADHGLPLKSGP